MRRFFVLAFVLLVIISCGRNQTILAPVEDEVLSENRDAGLPPDEVLPTEPVMDEESATINVLFYIDGVEHQKVFVSAEAALASEKYKNLITHYKEWNLENCGQLEKAFPDIAGFEFISEEAASAFIMVANISGETKRTTLGEQIASKYTKTILHKLSFSKVLVITGKCIKRLVLNRLLKFGR